MLKDNLLMLRNLHGFSQEEIAGKIGISRQAYAKWESGATIPDIEKCLLLAKVYGISVDSLVRTQTAENIGPVPPAPEGKNIWGSVSVNERGQIVIPKAVRNMFGLTGGQRLIVLTDEHEGIALVPSDKFEAKIQNVIKIASITNDE